MATDVLRLAESLLGRAASDRAERMTIESLAASDFFPKWSEDGEEPATQEERDEIADEYREIFEDAVADLTAVWGEPEFFGPAEECIDPWGPLGEEMASWPRGEFVVCVYFGQEDAELPFAVDVAVVRRDSDW